METIVDLSSYTVDGLNNLIAQARARLAKLQSAGHCVRDDEPEGLLINSPCVREIELGRHLVEDEIIIYMLMAYGTEALGYVAVFEEWFIPAGKDKKEFFDVRFETSVYPTADEAIADAMPNAKAETETEKTLNPPPPPEPEPTRPSWRDDPATEKQIARLESYGVNAVGMTKGQASDLISQHKATDPTVECWECGSTVPRSKATWDGNGWYCGC